jgi:hypothetical protein
VTTLLERRKRHLATEIEWVLLEADRLRQAVASGVDDAHGMARIMFALASRAQAAAMYARLVEDLDDVTKYGPEGGR